MMGGSVAEFADEDGSGKVGCIGHGVWSCATVSRMIVGRIVRPWYHGGARCQAVYIRCLHRVRLD